MMALTVELIRRPERRWRVLLVLLCFFIVLLARSEAAFLFQTTTSNALMAFQDRSGDVSCSYISSSRGSWRGCSDHSRTVTTAAAIPSTRLSMSDSAGVSVGERDDGDYYESHESNGKNVVLLQDHTEKLWSYFHNIQKVRRQKRRQEQQVGGGGSNGNQNSHNQRHQQNYRSRAAADGDNNNHNEMVVTLTKPVRSLVAFFLQNPLSSVAEMSSSTSTQREQFIEAWKGATIEALRAAGEANDHVLVLRLVDACCSYGSSINYNHEHSKDNILRLPPRWLGEAMEALSRTQANASKLKHLWKLAMRQQDEQKLSEPLSAFELNVACKALARRHKPRAALELYQTSGIAGDAYTASTLFTVLLESIQDNQEPLQEPIKQDESSLSSSGSPSSTSSSWSVCWQWNEAEILLRDLSNVMNNHAVCAALQLNERAAQVFGVTRQPGCPYHDGATIALNLLQRAMEEWRLVPDVVTCSLVMSALDKGFRNEDANALLQDMKRGGRRGSDSQISSWLPLPPPNVYTYSSAISACARCQQHTIALDLLQDMRTQGPAPNTWVYNAAISAAATSRPRRGGRRNDDDDDKHGSTQPLALRLLRQMQRDARQGLDTQPDTVTYNTVLSAFDDSNSNKNSVNSYNKGVSNDSSVHQAALNVLQEMKQIGIARDSITYRHAIFACQSNASLVLDLLDMAMEDSTSSSSSSFVTSKNGPESRPSKPHHSHSANLNNHRGLDPVVHGAMSVLGIRGDWTSAHRVFQKMQNAHIHPTRETWTYLITALGRGGQAALVPTMLQAIQGDAVAAQSLWSSARMDVRSKITVDVELFSAAISACLDANDITQALQVLSMMKSKGMNPTTSSLEAVTYAYARLALVAAAEETKEMRQRQAQHDDEPRLLDEQRLSATRAQNAFRLVQTLENAPAKLLSAVTRACAAAQLWKDAQIVLRILHGRAIREFGPMKHEIIQVLPNLHRSLLKMCASQGNVTAALWYVEDIQGIARRLSPEDERLGSSTDTNVSTRIPSSSVNLNQSSQTVRIGGRNIGMKAEDWKLLLISASKSGHWKLCINTLQLLQPFVEQARPSLLSRNDDELKLQQNYERLSRALIGTMLCLEMRSQYGWAVRVMDDWIQWGGRRPPHEAVLSAIRVLANRNLGEEVAKMLVRVLQVPAVLDQTQQPIDNMSYEEILYIGAITSLHNVGLYDDADDVYSMAISQGHLPYAVATNESVVTLDLHGMNVAIAHAAVRITFQQEIMTTSWNRTEALSDDFALWDKDILIVTGRGRNSAHRMRPVLRPEIQRMLLEEFYPPLSTVSVPGNLGAIRVPAVDIDGWLSHQREQRDVQLLTAANALKDLSSGNRIRRSIALTLRQQSLEPSSLSKREASFNVTNRSASLSDES